MRTGLRLAALLLLGLGLALWFFGGPNMGWTKTTVLIERVEEVTGLPERTWEKRFVPGLDFVGATALLAGLCYGASFFFRKK